MITLTNLKVGCGHVYVSWRTVNTEICTIHLSDVELYNSYYSYGIVSSSNYRNFTAVPSDALLTVDIFVSPTSSIFTSGENRILAYSTSVRTRYMEGMNKL